ILRHAGGRTVPSRPALPAEHLWRRSERMRGIRVRLEGLSKSFGSIAALRTLDLDIRAGELVAFLGPSGCGKTTTLLMIAGIYQPTSGVIHFGDRRVDHLHPRDRDVGMVFQSYALYPHLTLFENIAFPLRLKRQSQEEVKRRVQQTADLLGIGHLLDRRPAEVSGGQQQRTALARALVKEPQVLLLDEPLSNLDAQIRLQARSEIRRLRQEDLVLGGAIRGCVLVVETLGRQVLVTIDLDGTTVKMLADTRPAIGTQVGIGYSPGSLHYFGSDGRRIEARTA